MQLTYIETIERAPGVFEFSFQPMTTLEYVPGQYTRFTFPFHIADPHKKQHRTFTLISHPSERDIRFITRLEAPLSEYKQHLARLQSGDSIYIDEPRGDAILPKLSTTPLVFVAQGIALASYLSMLTECARSNLAHHMVLLWVRRSKDDPLETLIPGQIPRLVRVNRHYPESLTAAEIVPFLQSNSLIYLSGSQTFVETLGADLETAGIPRARLIYDYYSGYTAL